MTPLLTLFLMLGAVAPSPPNLPPPRSQRLSAPAETPFEPQESAPPVVAPQAEPPVPAQVPAPRASPGPFETNQSLEVGSCLVSAPMDNHGFVTYYQVQWVTHSHYWVALWVNPGYPVFPGGAFWSSRLQQYGRQVVSNAMGHDRLRRAPCPNPCVDGSAGG